MFSSPASISYAMLVCLVLAATRQQPIAAKPSGLSQPISGQDSVSRSVSQDYEDVQRILGERLPGSAKENMKIVDLLIQLLEEIDLPTLCDVIANDTIVRKSTNQNDGFNVGGSPDLDNQWKNSGETKKTDASNIDNNDNIQYKTDETKNIDNLNDESNLIEQPTVFSPKMAFNPKRFDRQFPTPYKGKGRTLRRRVIIPRRFHRRVSSDGTIQFPRNLRPFSRVRPENLKKIPIPLSQIKGLRTMESQTIRNNKDGDGDSSTGRGVNRFGLVDGGGRGRGGNGDKTRGYFYKLVNFARPRSQSYSRSLVLGNDVGTFSRKFDSNKNDEEKSPSHDENGGKGFMDEEFGDRDSKQMYPNDWVPGHGRGNGEQLSRISKQKGKIVRRIVYRKRKGDNRGKFGPIRYKVVRRMSRYKGRSENDGKESKYDDGGDDDLLYGDVVGKGRNNVLKKEELTGGAYRETKDGDVYGDTKDSDVYEEIKDSDVYEEMKDSDVNEEMKNGDVYEDRKDSDVYEETKDSDVYEEMKNGDVYEEMKNGDVYEETTGSDVYEETEYSNVSEETPDSYSDVGITTESQELGNLENRVEDLPKKGDNSEELMWTNTVSTTPGKTDDYIESESTSERNSLGENKMDLEINDNSIYGSSTVEASYQTPTPTTFSESAPSNSPEKTSAFSASFDLDAANTPSTRYDDQSDATALSDEVEKSEMAKKKPPRFINVKSKPKNIPNHHGNKTEVEAGVVLEGDESNEENNINNNMIDSRQNKINEKMTKHATAEVVDKRMYLLKSRSGDKINEHESIISGEMESEIDTDNKTHSFGSEEIEIVTSDTINVVNVADTVTTIPYTMINQYMKDGDIVNIDGGTEYNNSVKNGDFNITDQSNYSVNVTKNETTTNLNVSTQPTTSVTINNTYSFETETRNLENSTAKPQKPKQANTEDETVKIISITKKIHGNKNDGDDMLIAESRIISIENNTTSKSSSQNVSNTTQSTIEVPQSDNSTGLKTQITIENNNTKQASITKNEPLGKLYELKENVENPNKSNTINIVGVQTLDEKLPSSSNTSPSPTRDTETNSIEVTPHSINKNNDNSTTVSPSDYMTTSNVNQNNSSSPSSIPTLSLKTQIPKLKHHKTNSVNNIGVTTATYDDVDVVSNKSNQTNNLHNRVNESQINKKTTTKTSKIEDIGQLDVEISPYISNIGEIREDKNTTDTNNEIQTSEKEDKSPATNRLSNTNATDFDLVENSEIFQEDSPKSDDLNENDSDLISTSFPVWANTDTTTESEELTTTNDAMATTKHGHGNHPTGHDYPTTRADNQSTISLKENDNSLSPSNSISIKNNITNAASSQARPSESVDTSSPTHDENVTVALENKPVEQTVAYQEMKTKPNTQPTATVPHSEQPTKLNPNNTSAPNTTNGAGFDYTTPIATNTTTNSLEYNTSMADIQAPTNNPLSLIIDLFTSVASLFTNSTEESSSITPTNTSLDVKQTNAQLPTTETTNHSTESLGNNTETQNKNSGISKPARLQIHDRFDSLTEKVKLLLEKTENESMSRGSNETKPDPTVYGELLTANGSRSEQETSTVTSRVITNGPEMGVTEDVRIPESLSETTKPIPAESHIAFIETPKQDGAEMTTSNEIPKQDTAEMTTSNEIPKQDTAEMTTSNEIPKQDIAEMTTSNEIPKQDTAEMTTSTEIPKQDTAEMTTSTEIPKQDTAEMTTSTEIPKQDTAEMTTSTEIPKQDTAEMTTSTEIPKQDTAEMTTSTDIPKQDTAEMTTSTIISQLHINKTSTSTNTYSQNLTRFDNLNQSNEALPVISNRSRDQEIINNDTDKTNHSINSTFTISETEEQIKSEDHEQNNELNTITKTTTEKSTDVGEFNERLSSWKLLQGTNNDNLKLNGIQELSRLHGIHFPNKPRAGVYNNRLGSKLSDRMEVNQENLHENYDNFKHPSDNRIDSWKAFNIAVNKDTNKNLNINKYDDENEYSDAAKHWSRYDNFDWNSNDLEIGSNYYKDFPDNSMIQGGLPGLSSYARPEYYNRLMTNPFSRNIMAQNKRHEQDWGDRFSQGFYGRVNDNTQNSNNAAATSTRDNNYNSGENNNNNNDMFHQPFPNTKTRFDLPIITNHQIKNGKYVKDAQNENKKLEQFKFYEKDNSPVNNNDNNNNNINSPQVVFSKTNPDGDFSEEDLRKVMWQEDSRFGLNVDTVNQIESRDSLDQIESRDALDQIESRNILSVDDDVTESQRSGFVKDNQALRKTEDGKMNDFLVKLATSRSNSSGRRGLWPLYGMTGPLGVPAPDDYTCPGMFGYHSDPKDCQSFFICSWGIPYRLHCPAGTRFNREQSVCDWAVNVPCFTESQDKQ